MELMPFVTLFATLCFLEAYGIQKRKRWAWFGGWVFGFFAAGAVCSLSVAVLFHAQSLQDTILGCVFTVGGLCVWTFWAIWWATHRKMFRPKKAASVKRA
jgi:hypothetical protein